MAKGMGGLNGILIGILIGAGGLFAFEHIKNLSVSVTPTGPPAKANAGMIYSNVGILPGNELPFFDYLDDSYVTSEVWDRRTSVYRNDGVIYNTVGVPIYGDGTTDFHPEQRLFPSGAYTNGLEDGPRPRQQHAGGAFPECLAMGSDESAC